MCTHSLCLQPLKYSQKPLTNLSKTPKNLIKTSFVGQMLSARVPALCPQPGPRPDATLFTVQCRPAPARHSVTPFFVWSSLCLISQHYSLSPMYPSQHYNITHYTKVRVYVMFPVHNGLISNLTSQCTIEI